MKRNKQVVVLAKAEEELIRQPGHCLMKDVIEQLEDPEKPYSMISSVVRILEKKGFAALKAYGGTHECFLP